MQSLHKGFSIIEVILAVAIFSLFFFALPNYYSQAIMLSNKTTERIQASYLLEEGVNVTRIFRDSGWNANIKTLSTTTTYFLYWTGASWRSTTTAQLIENQFRRSFVVNDIKRDSNDDIVSSGGTYDPNTKKIIFSVAWQTNRGLYATDTITTIIPNLFSN